MKIDEFRHRCICCKQEKAEFETGQWDGNAFFENANAARGVRRARKLSFRAQQAYNTSHITVDKNGKRARLGRPRKGVRCLETKRCFHIDELLDIWDAAKTDNFFLWGDRLVVRRKNSWPMGGEESCEAVGIDSHETERCLHRSVKFRRKAGWDVAGLPLEAVLGGGRIVDNYLLWSFVLCLDCIDKGVAASLPRDFGMEGETQGPLQRFCTANLDTSRGKTELSPVPHNAAFSRMTCDSQEQCRIGTFSHTKINTSSQLRQFVIQAVARANFITEADSSDAVSAPLDLWWELIRLRYPPKMIARCFRSVPLKHPTPGLCLFRKELRTLLKESTPGWETEYHWTFD